MYTTPRQYNYFYFMYTTPRQYNFFLFRCFLMDATILKKKQKTKNNFLLMKKRLSGKNKDSTIFIYWPKDRRVK